MFLCMGARVVHRSAAWWPFLVSTVNPNPFAPMVERGSYALEGHGSPDSGVLGSRFWWKSGVP